MAPREPGTIPWVLRIARNTLIDYWRTDKRRDKYSLLIHDIDWLSGAAADSEASLRQRERRFELVRSIAKLPEADREFVSMKFVAHRTNREIAATLAILRGGREHAPPPCPAAAADPA
ncbi:MAG: hypothetical protein IT177_25115 [Acidobacteria bacterium]|nr:hypothetical protein [Acidobacteriota bacterium]